MIIVLDCETTGLDNATEAVVEVAAVGVVDGAPKWVWTSLINPQRPIPPTASAIHHLTDDDVADAPLQATAMAKLSVLLGSPTRPMLAAHRAEFDGGFLGLPVNICTWRCAAHLWPEAPGHSNQTLRYWLPGLHKEILTNAAKWAPPSVSVLWPPHRALPDAWVTAHILCRLLALRPAEELVRLTKTPILLRTIHFGMHRGAPWSEVPKDYIAWLLRQPDLEPDVRYTAEHHRGFRDAKKALPRVGSSYL